MIDDDSFEIIQMDGCTTKAQALAVAKHYVDQAINGKPDITPANAYAMADADRLLRMNAEPARYGQRIHPDMPLVLDRANINALVRSLRLMHSQATDTAAYALQAMMDDFEMMGLIHQLRADEGDSITILCDNPDGPPNVGIIGNGNWTGYDDRRIDGESLIDCLRQANAEREIFDAI